MNEAEKLAEITVDFYNAVEAASVNAKRQIAELYSPGTTTEQSAQQSKEPAAVQETTFTILKFESQQGTKLGEFEVAYKQNNIEDKWHHAYNILRNSNATINSRYHGQGYVYSYWLYGENKIYRQKLKPKP